LWNNLVMLAKLGNHYFALRLLVLDGLVQF